MPAKVPQFGQLVNLWKITVDSYSFSRNLQKGFKRLSHHWTASSFSQLFSTQTAFLQLESNMVFSTRSHLPLVTTASSVSGEKNQS